MSEETKNPPGMVPGGFKPTVINPKGRTMSPTVIKGGGSERNPPATPPPGPTTIKGSSAPSAPVTPSPGPSKIIPTSEPAPRAQAPGPSRISPPPPAPPGQPPIAVTQPSQMQGTVRKGIEVSIDEILKRFPGTSRELAEGVQKTLKRHVLELLTESECVHWGEENQRMYGELADRSLKLVANDSVDSSERHISRLYAILTELGEAIQNGGVQTFPWKSRVSPKDKFEASEREINQLRELLSDNLPALIDIEAQLTALSSEFETLDPKVDADCLAAQYTAENLLDKSKTRCIEALLLRAGSLQQTVAHIKQGYITRDSSAATIRQLVVRIQDGVLNVLPSWLESVTIAFRQSSSTKTDFFTIRKALDSLLHQLKPK